MIVEGRRYLDMLAAYSALNQGHGHPAILGAAPGSTWTGSPSTSRAFHNDRMGPFLNASSANPPGIPWPFPMNTGAEPVETAIKTGAEVGVNGEGGAGGPPRRTHSSVRTTSPGRNPPPLSGSPPSPGTDGFGPFCPGVPHHPVRRPGRAGRGHTPPSTVGFLVGPIQGERGEWWSHPTAICGSRLPSAAPGGFALMADEIPDRSGRTGRLFCCDWGEVRPGYPMVGKALGVAGSIRFPPVLADREYLDVFRPGNHGSTFGGTPWGPPWRRRRCGSSWGMDLPERFRPPWDPCSLDRLRELVLTPRTGGAGRGLMIGVVTA